MNNIGRNLFDIGYMDTLSAGDSPLHRLDPRAKLITTLVFIIMVVSFNKYEVASLTAFFIYPLFLISVGDLPAGYFLKKVLLVSPFAVFIGVFNPLIDSKVILYIGKFGISGGWVSFISIMIRFVLTVSAALILVALTGVNSICKSLLKFGVPKIFIIQLLFFNRYIFILTDEIERAARARSIRAFGSKHMSLKVFVSMISHLLLRTLDRAERIYCAMHCRGFDGDIHIIRKMKIGYREIIFVFGWIFLFVLLRYYNIPIKLGTFIERALK